MHQSSDEDSIFTGCLGVSLQQHPFFSQLARARVDAFAGGGEIKLKWEGVGRREMDKLAATEAADRAKVEGGSKEVSCRLRAAAAPAFLSLVHP